MLCGGADLLLWLHCDAAYAPELQTAHGSLQPRTPGATARAADSGGDHAGDHPAARQSRRDLPWRVVAVLNGTGRMTASHLELP